MIKEIWVPILGYEELYWVSNFGRIKTLGNGKTHKTERILRPEKLKNGYLRVCLYRDGKAKPFSIHRLVWAAFNGPIPNGMQINHLNEDKTDNRLENLSLVSAKANCNWGTRNRRMVKSLSKMVEQYTLDGEHIMTRFSAKGVKEELGHLGFDNRSISACCLGKLKTHNGYIWKYRK